MDTKPTPLASRIAARLAAAAGVGKYLTTADTCQCPDHQYRKRVCKHMLAYRVLFGEEDHADNEQATDTATGEQRGQ